MFVVCVCTCVYMCVYVSVCVTLGESELLSI